MDLENYNFLAKVSILALTLQYHFLQSFIPPRQPISGKVNIPQFGNFCWIIKKEQILEGKKKVDTYGSASR